MKRGAFLYPLSPMPAWAERLFPEETVFAILRNILRRRPTNR